MRRLKQILMTMAVIFFTALSLYNFQREVPISDKEYSAYAYSLYEILCCSVGIMLILLISRYRNNLIVGCLLFNSIIFVSVGIKSYFNVSEAHMDYDFIAIGLGAIVSFSYLIAPYYKKVLSLLKTIINQAYMRCQTSKKSG